MPSSADASLPELVIIAVVALPSLLVPVAILYLVFSAGRRRDPGVTGHPRRLEHGASPNG